MAIPNSNKPSFHSFAQESHREDVMRGLMASHSRAYAEFLTEAKNDKHLRISVIKKKVSTPFKKYIKPPIYPITRYFCYTCDKKVDKAFLAGHTAHDVIQTNIFRHGSASTQLYSEKAEPQKETPEKSVLPVTTIPFKKPEAKHVSRDNPDKPSGILIKKAPKHAAVREAVYKRDGHKCLNCGEDDLTKLSLDHILAACNGGKWYYENLQTLCKRCNVGKGTRMIDFIHPESDYYYTKVAPIKIKHSKKQLHIQKELRIVGQIALNPKDIGKPKFTKQSKKLLKTHEIKPVLFDVNSLISSAKRSGDFSEKVHPKESIDWCIKIFGGDGTPNNLKEHLAIQRGK